MDLERDDARASRGAATRHVVLIGAVAAALGVLVALALIDLWGRTA